MKISKKEKNRLQNEKKFIDFVDSVANYEIAESKFLYVNARQKVKMRHTCCGTEWQVVISKFINDGSRCPNVSCFTEKRVAHLRNSDKFFNKIKNKYEILEANFRYTSKKERVSVRHIVCGHEFSPIIGNLIRDLSICPACKVKNRKDRVHEKIISLFEDIGDYDLIEQDSQIRSDDKIKVRHEKCGTIFYPTAHNFKDSQSRCPRCSGSGSSKAEKEVVDWLKSIYSYEVQENTRNVISPKELDVYVPGKNFAIEYNGLYWHSGEKIGKNSHLEKTKRCAEKDIKLFHIFSDEWDCKKDIVKSMIQHRLNRTLWTVFARKCDIRQVDKKQGAEFFERCHISGDNRASIYFGLFYKDKMQACLSLKKPIQKKYKNSIEIARFATELFTVVPGGFSKLLKRAEQYAKENSFSSILTYADNRFGTGQVYEKNNFVYIDNTPVDYWYTDGIKRQFRFKYRARNGLTEKQIAEQAGVWRVYGCGSRIYIKVL